MTFTFTFPKRSQYEEERNYFWEKYFQPSLLHRQNWEYKTYNENEVYDVVYSSNAKMNIHSSINANLYHIVEAVSDKVIMNKKLQGSKYVPKMFFNFKNRKEIESALDKNFFYLKGATGSTSKSTFIINGYTQIEKTIHEHPEIKDWFLSENIDSYLYKRKGVYQPNGVVYDEQYGHKGRMKFFILFKIDKNSKEIYMYDQSVFEIAPEEFRGDRSSRPQNIIIGMGSEELHGYPKDYDTDPDYGFTPIHVFGDDYFKIIVPQLGNMTRDIFQAVHKDLYCKNDKYYNEHFKSCFHFGTVDVIITPDLKCYFLEINTKPVMDRPSYESIINYPSMIDSLVQLCIDPYFKPLVPSIHTKGWHKIASVKRSAKHTFYISPTWKFTKHAKDFFKERENWEQIIYPNYLLPKYKIDFVGKRKREIENIGDPVFSKGRLISKIFTLDHYLGNKKNMYDILSNDPRSFKFLPKTLTFTLDDPSWQSKIKSLKTAQTWILKPSIGLRGQDIFISNKSSELIHFIKDHSNYTDWVLSEYIDQPYLLKLNGVSNSGVDYNDKIGRKVHIRIYVLISKIKNKVHIYLYDKPLLFAAVKEYNNDITDSFAHLTNLYLGSLYYNEKGLDGSLAYRDLSFPLIETVDNLYGNSFYNKKLLPQIKYILKIILINAKEYLLCNNEFIQGKRDCFQNIALDLMPDSHWKLYLLEINGKPGMNAPLYHWGGNIKDYTYNLMDSLLKSEKDKKEPSRKTTKNKKNGTFIEINGNRK